MIHWGMIHWGMIHWYDSLGYDLLAYDSLAYDSPVFTEPRSHTLEVQVLTPLGHSAGQDGVNARTNNCY